MAKCKHETVRGDERWIFCCACRRHLPLGPANDSLPEVRIEIWAAEIARWDLRECSMPHDEDGAAWSLVLRLVDAIREEE